jgi:hypothetical protein
VLKVVVVEGCLRFERVKRRGQQRAKKKDFQIQIHSSTIYNQPTTQRRSSQRDTRWHQQWATMRKKITVLLFTGESVEEGKAAAAMQARHFCTFLLFCERSNVEPRDAKK